MANLSQASLRHANLALVARTVLAADDPPSRAGVAAATSLTRSTVSRLVDELVAAGVLEEVGSVVGGPGRPGRPATPLRASTGRFAALGLQIGVGHLAARLLDLSGTVIAEHLVSADLAASRPGPTLRRLRAVADRGSTRPPSAAASSGPGSPCRASSTPRPGACSAPPTSAGRTSFRPPRWATPCAGCRSRSATRPTSRPGPSPSPHPDAGANPTTSSTSAARSASAARWCSTAAS